MRTLFGTDGVRSEANKGSMTPEICMLLAAAAAGTELKRGNHRHNVVIAKDTRLSGYLIEPAIISGFISVGMDVTLVGPLPTPAVAFLTKSLRADLGVMISASHNPYYDNGIKFFGSDGYKLSDEIEKKIERRFETKDINRAFGDTLGRASRLNDAGGRYIEFAKNTFNKKLSLEGIKIVIDCANGATYKVAPKVLWELGADVISMGVSPNGININNESGALAPDSLCQAVRFHSADIGIALDGDGDRLVICDENGEIIDGDNVIATITKYWLENNWLKNKEVVSTVMSNMAFDIYMNSIGINVHRTNVGDRYVVESMLKRNVIIGGESSGHIILLDHNTTGDGLIAALQILSIMAEKKQKVSKMVRLFNPLPQTIKNVRVNDKNSLKNPKLIEVLNEAEKKLSTSGRLLVRPSGTEPLLRIMVESENCLLVTKIIDDILQVLLNERILAA